MLDRWLVSARGSVARSAAVAVAAPALATSFALIAHPGRELGAVSIFFLGVVAAAALGGLRSGLASAVLSFVSLNYFFTEPRHTFRVARGEDVVALATFLVVALIVGSLVAKTLEAGGRAARRERESRLLSYAATKALSGESLEVVLGDMASALLEALRLQACAIHARVGDRAVDVRRERRGQTPGRAEEAPLEAAGSPAGTLVAVLPAGVDRPSPDDRLLLEAAARQISILLERTALDLRVADARIEVEANEVRAALFSSVTHDLRTPLASIKAGVTTLMQADANVDESQRDELLRTVLEETDRLNRLVGNLLDLARVRAGALAPAKEPTALDEVVESVLHRLRGATSGHRVRTVFRDAPEVPADPVQIDQVVSNLVENAARHSPPDGEITIAIAPWRGAVQVRVSDEGPGIPAQDRDRAFEAFWRGDESTRGSGLGLAIARAIVLAHGGRIRIEGAPGGGASVVFELPVTDVPAIAQEERS